MDTRLGGKEPGPFAVVVEPEIQHRCTVTENRLELFIDLAWTVKMITIKGVRYPRPDGIPRLAYDLTTASKAFHKWAWKLSVLFGPEISLPSLRIPRTMNLMGQSRTDKA